MADCRYYYVSIFLLVTLHITYFLPATGHMQVLFACLLGANVAGLERWPIQAPHVTIPNYTEE